MLSCLVSVCGEARAGIVINEFLPDPPGSDAGHEFVELFNNSAQAVSLAGVEFQFANGADLQPSWQTRWSAAGTDSIPALSFYLLVDTNWLGPPAGNDQVRLSLQNGPDAVRLVRGSEVLDLVGYGELTGADFFEGHPAVAASGQSLARRPDGRDSGDNAADFLAASASPGFTNFPQYALEILDWGCEPPTARPQDRVTVSADLHNIGLRDLDTEVLLLVLGGQRVEAAVAGFPSDDRRLVRWEIRPDAPGRPTLEVLVPTGGDPDTLVTTLGRLQVGPGEMALNEVQAAPEQGEGEWVELACTGPRPVSLADYRIRDEDGVWRDLPPLGLGPGELVVLAADTAALGAWYRENRSHGDPLLGVCPDAPVMVELAAWPSLNNSPPQTRDYCDRLWLADSLGVIDHLKLLAAGGGDVGVPLPEDGRSLERTSLALPGGGAESSWRPCATGSGGSPGCAPREVSPEGSGEWMSLPARVLDRRQGPLVLEVVVTITAPATGFTLRVFNLWGEQVRTVGGDGAGPGSRLCHWFGDDDAGRQVAPGGYIVVGELQSDLGATLSRARTVVGVR